ncbi:MAG: hypothetical protein HQK60_01740 [Deltaproteobacteria bacterium]|nr:hypothetical protein [Deltaproteobacteria bacterium]
MTNLSSNGILAGDYFFIQIVTMMEDAVLEKILEKTPCPIETDTILSRAHQAGSSEDEPRSADDKPTARPTMPSRDILKNRLNPPPTRKT